MKVKYLLYVLLILSLSCVPKTAVNTEKNVQDSQRCKFTFDFLKNELVKTERGYYKFKDLEKIYEQFDKGTYPFPFNDCLVGKKVDFVKEVLGTPHHEVISYQENFHSITYCFDTICMQKPVFYTSTGIALFCTVNENDELTDCILFPDYMDSYRHLDRSKQH